MLKGLIIKSAPRSFHEWNHFRNHKEGYEKWKNQNFLFIHVPKGAGTSINHALGMPDLGHYTYMELCAKSCDFQEKDLIFAVHRDPLQRIISTYNYACKKEKEKGYSSLSSIISTDGINGFVQKKLPSLVANNDYFFKSTCKMLEGSPSSRTYLINFELLSDGFALIKKNLLWKAGELRKVNTSKGAFSSISEESVQVIRELYADDFELSKNLAGYSLRVFDEVKSGAIS
ncbi:hypothetical protein WCN91_01975 [Pseudoalteromonas sp. YIC-827]|uniref:Sulfotransferase family protein n=1 Tax=Pseudoalteromonas qingdaonensis TaxID=3131913 RepID=A0ABU9MV56_9GAMM